MSLTNRFTEKMKEKTMLELEQIVERKDQYQKEAYLAAIAELDIRKSGKSATDSIGSQDKIDVVESKGKEIEKPTKASSWGWIPRKLVFDHLGLYSLFGIVSVFFMLPGTQGIYLVLVYLLPSFISFWQINIDTTKGLRRGFYFQNRVIYSIYSTLLILLWNYVKDEEPPDFTWLFLFLLFLLISGLICILPYFVTFKRFINPKYYFLRSIRVFLPISLVIYFLLIVQEERWFFQDSKVQWDGENPIGADHFRGYPDFFTKYDAAIRSFLDYDFDDKDQLIFLNAVSNPRYCWINPWDRDDYFLLQHERYHFNITEVVARKTRKRILDTLKFGSDRAGIELILGRAKSELRKMQSQYDLETDHSIITDKQSYWQFYVDSLLIEYDPYWTSKVFASQDRPDSIKYFRDYTFKDFDKIVPVDEIMPNEEEYSNCLRVAYDKMSRITEMEYFFQGVPSQESYLGFSVVKISYSDMQEIWRFYDVEGNPVAIDYGYHEVRYFYDGNTIEISHWDTDSNPIKRDAKEHITYVHYKNSNEWEERFYNKYGKRTELANKVYYHTLKLSKGTLPHYSDSLFFKTRERFDRYGNPVDNSNGKHRTVFGRDRDGRLVYTASTNSDGKYILDEGIVREIRTYNELGNFQSVEYYDENFDPMENKDGVFKKTWSTDRYGNASRMSTYNANGRLVEVNGEATYYKKFDSRNNMTMYAGYDSGDKLVFTENNFGKVLYEYDSVGLNYKITNLNGYDFPINSDISSAVQVYDFDSLGRVISGRNFDKDMLKVEDDRGVHMYTDKYDSSGNLIESKYFDLDNELAPVIEDVAIFRYSYDKRKNKVESRFYDKFDKLARANQGVAINRYVFDEKNRMIERSYYDSLDRLALFDGVAKVKWRYNGDNRKTEERYYDVEDRPMSDVALSTWDYNKQGKITLQKQISPKGTDAIGAIPMMRVWYDNAGNRIKESYYRLNGLPTVDKQFIHSYEIDYEDNRVIEVRYYDTFNHLVEDGSGIAGYTNILDQRGNTTKQSFFGSDGQLTNDTSGVSITRFSYDLSDRILTESYFDLNDVLVNKSDLFATLYRELDRSGNYTLECYYDSDGNLANNSNGNALIFARYSRNSSRTETSYAIDDAIEFLKNNERYGYLMKYPNDGSIE